MEVMEAGERHIVVANCNQNHDLEGVVGLLASSARHVWVRLNEGHLQVSKCVGACIWTLR
jgi:hypothetical protein